VSVRIHHLSCGTSCPIGGRLVSPALERVVCHCLLVETDEGLVLVDSGLGLAELSRTPSKFEAAAAFHRYVRDPEASAVRQITRRGFKAADVRHIVLTHLDIDHAGGILDFPQATVHVMSDELDAARRPGSLIERWRYKDFAGLDRSRWERHAPRAGEPWHGFACVREPAGLPPEILMIPLAGHTRGHAGVAIATAGGWLLHAGDSYYERSSLETAGDPRRPAQLRVFERGIHVDFEAAMRNQGRIAELLQAHSDEVRIFCSHDRFEFDTMCAGA
jgi:glyoxylase-like metal-dependent hydrolase (beta-lactamase superfamily II)